MSIINIYLEPIIVDTPRQYLRYKQRERLADLKRKMDAYMDRYNRKAMEIIDEMNNFESIMPTDLAEEQRVEYRALFLEHKKVWLKEDSG